MPVKWGFLGVGQKADGNKNGTDWSESPHSARESPTQIPELFVNRSGGAAMKLLFG